MRTDIPARSCCRVHSSCAAKETASHFSFMFLQNMIQLPLIIFLLQVFLPVSYNPFLYSFLSRDIILPGSRICTSFPSSKMKKTAFMGLCDLSDQPQPHDMDSFRRRFLLLQRSDHFPGNALPSSLTAMTISPLVCTACYSHMTACRIMADTVLDQIFHRPL